MGVFNYYRILGIPYDVSIEMIKQAYEEKMPQARSNVMAERYKTAYYTLTDTRRRQKYALFSFYWCFLIVVIIYETGLIVMENDELSVLAVLEFIEKYKLETYILALFSIADLVIHYYIRRLNRFLKHYKREVIDEKEGDSNG